ncbi:uroporphyrinogen decarboxylase family protein, partial [Staphylococcus pettenkoferi]|uniref:uroporphyrinogen decarboxylase family protein n=1 Tax=Staphylococcus pettenkoferi TaxID=170573 RepID=UPI003B979C8C
MAFTPPPFTLPSYIIQTAPSNNYHFTKPIIYPHQPTSFPFIHHLLHISIPYLTPQIQPRPQLIQLFDSSVRTLNVTDYPRY